MAIRPLVTAWAHVRVMIKRRILAQVLLEEIGEIERLLPRDRAGPIERQALQVPRPRFIVEYPAHYVTYFDAGIAALARTYLDALEDYIEALARAREPLPPAAGQATAPSAAAGDLLWPHVRRLRQAGDGLRTALLSLAGKRSGQPTRDSGARLD